MQLEQALHTRLVEGVHCMLSKVLTWHAPAQAAQTRSANSEHVETSYELELQVLQDVQTREVELVQFCDVYVEPTTHEPSQVPHKRSEYIVQAAVCGTPPGQLPLQLAQTRFEDNVQPACSKVLPLTQAVQSVHCRLVVAVHGTDSKKPVVQGASQVRQARFVVLVQGTDS